MKTNPEGNLTATDNRLFTADNLIFHKELLPSDSRERLASLERIIFESVEVMEDFVPKTITLGLAYLIIEEERLHQLVPIGEIERPMTLAEYSAHLGLLGKKCSEATLSRACSAARAYRILRIEGIEFTMDISRAPLEAIAKVADESLLVPIWTAATNAANGHPTKADVVRAIAAATKTAQKPTQSSYGLLKSKASRMVVSALKAFEANDVEGGLKQLREFHAELITSARRSKKRSRQPQRKLSVTEPTGTAPSVSQPIIFEGTGCRVSLDGGAILVRFDAADERRHRLKSDGYEYDGKTSHWIKICEATLAQSEFNKVTAFLK